MRTAPGMRAPAASPPPEVAALAHWVGRQPEPVAVEVSCAEHPDPAAGAGRDAVLVRLRRCLSEIPAYALLEVLTGGAGSVTLRLDGCASPDPGRWRDLPVGGPLLTVVDTPPPARRFSRRREVLDAGELPVSRRLLLGLSGVGRDAEPAHAPPTGRETAQERLVAALRALAVRPAETASHQVTTDDAATSGPGPGAPGQGAPGSLAGTGAVADQAPEGSEPAQPGDPWQRPAPGWILTAEGCTACGICVRSCPDEALALTVDLDASVLTQQPANCSGCGECVRVCPVNAMVEAGRHPWSALLVDATVIVIELDTEVCERCGAAFPPDGDELCPTCAFRRDNPFGSISPEEMLRRMRGPRG